MAKSVKMADIAQKLGVSIVTVSKALNNKEGVGDKMRSNIIQTAQEMGYEMPKSVLLKRESRTIGIINSYVYLQKGTSFYWGLYEKLLKNLMEFNSIGILEVINKPEMDTCSVPKLVKDRRVDGLIIMGSFPDDYMKMISSLNIPVVMLDTYIAEYDYDTVISGDYYGMYIMTNYLIKQGHKKIAFVGSVGVSGIMTDRFYGYCKAMAESGMKVTGNMIIPDSITTADMNINIPPDIAEKYTALACCCDYSAYESMHILNAMGLKVPDDISIVSYDNVIPEVTPVKITTYEVNQSKMASESVRQICERIENPLKPHETVTINGNIIIRDSVKKI
ncbi:MAG: LacI family DNA-binding transcriptional regulator [Ruminococcus sp.]|nr:LacI family DNA-binding transcriptional regulator [Ruminococcus sp.]